MHTIPHSCDAAVCLCALGIEPNRQGSSWGDDTTWSNDALDSALAKCNDSATAPTELCKAALSWSDQRRWGIDFALEALRTDSTHTQQGADTDLHKNKYTPLIQEIERELQELVPRRPDP